MIQLSDLLASAYDEAVYAAPSAKLIALRVRLLLAGAMDALNAAPHQHHLDGVRVSGCIAGVCGVVCEHGLIISLKGCYARRYFHANPNFNFSNITHFMRNSC